MTARYRSRLKIRVTLTLMPLAMVAVIAGRPARVAGILIMTFGLPIDVQSRSASAAVASVSFASSGETSMETRPSYPFDSAYTSAKMSAALPTSAVVIAKIASATFLPSATSSRTCSSYASPLASADAKMVGLVVTPTTFRSAISRSSPCPLMRSRDRSSSQMLTPAADSAAVGVPVTVSVVLMLPPSRRRALRAPATPWRPPRHAPW